VGDGNRGSKLELASVGAWHGTDEHVNNALDVFHVVIDGSAT
jgi:hypothetical protein